MVSTERESERKTAVGCLLMSRERQGGGQQEVKGAGFGWGLPLSCLGRLLLLCRPDCCVLAGKAGSSFLVEAWQARSFDHHHLRELESSPSETSLIFLHLSWGRSQA